MVSHDATRGRVLLRADASSRIGTGHVVRCLTLARFLTARGWKAELVGRFPNGLAGSAERSGVAVRQLPDALSHAAEPAWLDAAGLLDATDLVVTDHYDLGAAWHRAVARPAMIRMAIDDLARDPQDVDLVLNQNLGASTDRYHGLVPPGTVVLAGPRYALVRPEFAEARARRRPPTGRIERILVFMSGADEHDVTRRAAEAALFTGGRVDVIVGSAYPFVEGLRAWGATQPAVTLHVDTQDMAMLMARADLAIGAPSSATWERCTLGLPAVVVTLAANQREVATLLAEAGAAISLGWHAEVTMERVASALTDLAAHPIRVRAMAVAAAAVTDGAGGLRVVEALERLTHRSAV